MSTETLTDVPALAVGDLVRLDEYSGTAAQRAITWKVTAVPEGRGTRYSIAPATGGSGLKAARYQLVKVDGTAADIPQQVDYVPVIGSIVVVKDEHERAIRGYESGRPLVVIAVKGDEMQVAYMGGHANRAWRHIPMRMIRKATPADVHMFLADALA